MKTATLETSYGMAKKPKTESENSRENEKRQDALPTAKPTAGAAKPHSGAIKIDPTLAGMLVEMADFYGITVADKLNPILEPIVIAWFTEYERDKMEQLKRIRERLNSQSQKSG